MKVVQGIIARFICNETVSGEMTRCDRGRILTVPLSEYLFNTKAPSYLMFLN
jgi:hypothetical protein